MTSCRRLAAEDAPEFLQRRRPRNAGQDSVVEDNRVFYALYLLKGHLPGLADTGFRGGAEGRVSLDCQGAGSPVQGAVCAFEDGDTSFRA